MLYIIKRYGKTGTTWQTLFRMYGDRGEEELMNQVSELVESRQAYEFDGNIYPGPVRRQPEKSKIACYRHGIS